MAQIRLQKVLAQAGVTSRRAAERLIALGRVAIDGKVTTELGTRVDPEGATITVDGKPVALQASLYVLLHKPKGTVCTMHDPEGRPTIAQLVRDVPGRVVPVGRLDYDTSGALLLTNDGDLAARLTHPSGGTAKVYVAKVAGRLTERDLARWRERIEIDGKRTQPAQVRLLREEGDKSWLEIVLREGKNRQIHRLGDHAGFGVMRLVRVSFAGLNCDDLLPGKWRYLTSKEVFRLQRDAGLAAPPRARAQEPSARGRPKPPPRASSANRRTPR